MRYTRPQSRILAILALALAVVLGTGLAQAQTTSVWNTTDGIFNTPGNWTPDFPYPTTNFLFSVPNTTYTVTWTADATTYGGALTGANQNVTFDLGGFTHRMNQAGTDFTLGNAGDNSTLTVSNGTFRVDEGTNWILTEGAGNSLIVTNGGKVRSSHVIWAGNLMVSGPGSYVMSADGGAGGTASTSIVNNAASMQFRPGQDSSALWLIDNATVTNQAGSILTFAGSTMRVINGGKLVSAAGWGASALTLGLQSGNSARLIVGNTGAVSMVEQAGITHEEWYSTQRGNVEVIVSTNGIAKLAGTALNPVYTTGSYVTVQSSGSANWRVQDNSIITLRGGAIAMNTNSVIALTDNNANTSPGFSTEAGTAILRGYGTISNYNAGANFRILNHGTIRPGDIGYEVGTHSNIVGFGTIDLIRGDLLMTNALSYVGSSIYFDFSDTQLDQINITGGSALITGGSNIFTLASGSAPFVPGAKWGLGVYDFIVASNLVWSPEYADLTNILNTAGLQQGIDYQFGVVGIEGGLQALRLQFVPEPSTALLLVGGGLMLWRVRRRK